MIKIQFPFHRFLFGFLVVLAACTPNAPAIQTSTVSPSAAPIMLPTNTPIARPTHPLMPTLSYESQYELYGLLKNNGGCELPCFLGIIPGKTAWVEANTLLGKYSMNKPIKYDESSATSANKQYSASILTNKDINLDILLMIDVNKNDIVTHINIDANVYNGNSLAFDDQHLSKYSLRNIFQEHGQPDIVYLSPPERGLYTIYVIYEELKIVIGLSGVTKKTLNDGYKICPNLGDGDIPTMKIAVANPIDPIDVKTLIGYPFWEGVPAFEEVAGMSLDDFYKLMISEKQPACFEIKQK